MEKGFCKVSGQMETRQLRVSQMAMAVAMAVAMVVATVVAIAVAMAVAMALPSWPWFIIIFSTACTKLLYRSPRALSA